MYADNEQVDVEKGSTLKRGFSLQDAALFGIGGAVGSGILFAAAGGTAFAGPGVVISWIIAAIMITIVTIPFAEFSSMAPRGGISARIGYYSFGSYGGFIGGWALFLWAVMIPPIEAVAVATYASYWVPQFTNGTFLTPLGIFVSVIITIFFVLLNLAGVKGLGKFNTIITWIKVGVVVMLIIIVPLVLFHSSNFTTPSFILPTNGWSGIFIAIPASGILFSFGGYRQVADMAGEIKNPKRNLPLAIGITIVVQSVLYILMAVVIVGAVDWKALNFAPGDWGSVSTLGIPLADLMRAGSTVVPGFGGPLLAGLVVVALAFAVFSPLGTFGVFITGASRIVFGFTRENALPQKLGATNKRGVPTYAILLVAVVGDLFLIPLHSWYSLVDFVVVAAVVNFAIVAASVPIIRKSYPNLHRPFKVPFGTAWSLVAFVVASLLIYWSTYPTTLYALGATLAGSVVFLYQGIKTKWHNINLKGSIWIPIYIMGLMILSYLGSSITGGSDIIPFPYDVYVVIAYGIVFWIISQVSASKEPLGDMQSLVENAPVDAEA